MLTGPRAVITRLRNHFRRPRTLADERRKVGRWRDDLYFPEFRLGFITVPKTANTSLKYAIIKSLPEATRQPLEARIEELGTKQSIHRALRESPYKCMRERLLQSDVEHILTTVRHPEARLKSFYADKVLGDGWSEDTKARIARLYGIDAHMSFDGFVARLADLPDNECELHFRSQTDIIGADLLRDPRLSVIRTEFFSEDFAIMMETIELCFREPRKENATTVEGFDISSNARALIAQRFEQDFALFHSLASGSVLH